MRHVAFLGLAVAVLSAFAAALSGFGYQQGQWGLGTSFFVLRWAVYAAIGAAVVSAIGGIGGLAGKRGRTGLWGLLGVVLAVPAFTVPLGYLRVARAVPPIHDITTDTADPPAFVAILPLRAEAPNSAEYGGEELAALQSEAYPDITTARYDMDTARVFAAARAAAEAMGWTIVDASEGEGRIEASDTTFWFGFVDDVVIRVAASGSGSSRVDVRSLSRVGQSDVGKNAARIRDYLARLGAELER